MITLGHAGTPEYERVREGFEKTMGAGKIVEIERVENANQRAAFCTTLRNIRETTSGFDSSAHVRMLYHGTGTPSALQSIVGDRIAGFLPVKSGERTGDKYGKVPPMDTCGRL